MKKQLQRIFMVMLCLASAWSVQAQSIYDFEMDGIYYKFSGYGNVAVAPNNNSGGTYSGDVVIPASVTYEGPEDYNGTTYPVNAIYDQAFFNCSDLTSVTLPNSILSIGNFAFDSCIGLTEITLPSSLESIGEYAFWFCENLTKVYCLATTPPAWNKKADDGDDTFDYATVYVTENAMFYYETSNPWSDCKLDTFTPTDAIEEVDALEAKIYANNGILFIENAPAGEQVAIYNLLGQAVKTAKIQEGSNSFTLASGVYLVKCAHKTVKVQL